jgi:hypothetical protein
MKVALPKCFRSGHSQAKCPDLLQFRHRFPFSCQSCLSLLIMGSLGMGFGLKSFDSEGRNLIDVGVSGLGLSAFAGVDLPVGLFCHWGGVALALVRSIWIHSILFGIHFPSAVVDVHYEVFQFLEGVGMGYQLHNVLHIRIQGLIQFGLQSLVVPSSFIHFLLESGDEVQETFSITHHEVPDSFLSVDF